MTRMNELWNDVLTWPELERRFKSYGVTQVQVKFLKPNHNSKNQIAGMGSDLAAFGHLFLGYPERFEGRSKKPKSGPPIYRSKVPWMWLAESGLSPAPETKMIYYPQYPEIRLSGFLDGSPNAPRILLAYSKTDPNSRAQEEGRCLVFGPGQDRKVYAAVVTRHSPAAHYLQAFNGGRGKLAQLSLREDSASSREVLFNELRLIHAKEWIGSYRLRSDGTVTSCEARNCHGVTLESELGIPANSKAAPDFLDWEVKGHKVAHLNGHLSSRITLLTPNPDSGRAKSEGTTWLTKTYGTINLAATRYDLSGVHASGIVHVKTGLEFGLEGFNAQTGKITDDGYIFLRDPKEDEPIARWSFTKLLGHWQKKHAKAAFVPCIGGAGGEPRQYKYGTKIHVGEGTSFLRFLTGVSNGSIVMDPGLNTQLMPNGSWEHHTRFQFRTSLTRASELYTSFEKVTL